MAAAATQGVTDEIEPKAVADGIRMDIGYGPDGVSVQGPGAVKKDREIMQKVVLRGQVSVTAREICDSMRYMHKPQDERKKALPKSHFEKVMEAGFAQYPVAKLVGKGTDSCKVVFATPPVGDRKKQIVYHNLLVDLCMVSLRQFTSGIQEKVQSRE